MFQIGDEVVINRDYMDANITGLKARVIGYSSMHGISLEFDQVIPGVRRSHYHDCRGLGRYGYCWNVPSSHMKLAEQDDRTIVERKCRKRWNNSNFVKKNPQFVY